MDDTSEFKVDSFAFSPSFGLSFLLTLFAFCVVSLFFHSVANQFEAKTRATHTSHSMDDIESTVVRTRLDDEKANWNREKAPRRVKRNEVEQICSSSVTMKRCRLSSTTTRPRTSCPLNVCGACENETRRLWLWFTLVTFFFLLFCYANVVNGNWYHNYRNHRIKFTVSHLFYCRCVLNSIFKDEKISTRYRRHCHSQHTVYFQRCRLLSVLLFCNYLKCEENFSKKWRKISTKKALLNCSFFQALGDEIKVILFSLLFNGF